MTVSTMRQWNWTRGIWLALALLAHALLLLLPLSPIEFSAPTTNPLKIRFLPFVRVTDKALPAALQPTANTAHAKATDRVGEDAALVADTPVATETEAEKAAEHITLARLIDSLHHARLEDPQVPVQRQLGVHPAYELPSYWRASAPDLLPADNVFSGMVNPAQTEIVDRWLTADGSHNVVVNLPNGDTLCGRAPAWDPMRPQVEHVMEFRNCGGGGKRTFSMPAREAPEISNTN